MRHDFMGSQGALIKRLIKRKEMKTSLSANLPRWTEVSPRALPRFP
jgi:hypothetical protein